MADPKYANLYGIAHDQPDVYETCDLPEADQGYDLYEEKSEAIERLHISAPEAFSKFKGKQLDAASVDFSDRVGKNRSNGYNVRSQTWELAGFGENESPLEKYNRLKLEAEHLIEEVSTLSKKNETDLTKAADTLAVSVDSVNHLLSKIVDVKLEDKIGADFTHDTSKSDKLLFDKIINDLDDLGNEASSQPSQKVASLDVTSDIRNAGQYIFTLKPSQQKQVTSRVTDLEQKISKLETLIGSNTNQVVRLCNINTDDGLITCCQWMIAKLSLLDSSQLDLVESKINSINSKTEQILNSQNSVSQDPEKEKKINELYELCNRAKEKSDTLTNIIERMTALESLHRQGKQSVQTITHLETLQAEIATKLANNNALLNNVKENLSSNISVIKDNVESLKTRVENLLSKR
ncbi:hypothetical protein V9T40_011055 [Parthenolecanium corni]|uniref:Dynactin subunit 2 n=1 Tax=Parthenolecanium corni TaxID=536013 RepID=A0AAN9T883_9HEMI